MNTKVNHILTVLQISSQECDVKIESDQSLIPWPSYQQESELQSHSGSSDIGDASDVA